MIFNYLRPYFSELLPDEGEFKEVFELYELITCMNHIQRKSNSGLPEGTYSRDSNRFAYKQFLRLIDQGETSPLYSSGLFVYGDDLKASLEEHFRDAASRYR